VKTEAIIDAARAAARANSDAVRSITRLIGVAETLGSVLARIELGREPQLLTVTVTALADLIDEQELLRALPAGEARLTTTGEACELHTPIELRNSAGRWLGDVLLVWSADRAS
jgi:hypothetical protein